MRGGGLSPGTVIAKAGVPILGAAIGRAGHPGVKAAGIKSGCIKGDDPDPTAQGPALPK